MNLWSNFLVNLLLALFFFFNRDRYLSYYRREVVYCFFCGLDWGTRGNCCLVVENMGEKEIKLLGW